MAKVLTACATGVMRVPLVVGELKLVQVISEKLLSVDACQVEIIKGWGIIRCCRAHEAFEVINCVVVGSQKKKF